MQNSPPFKKLFFFAGDILVLYLSLFITVWVGFGVDFEINIFLNHLSAFSFLFVFWLLLIYVLGFYDNSAFFKIGKTFFFKLVLAIVIFFSFSGLFFYFLPFDISPKTNLIVNTITLGVFFSFWRTLTSHTLFPRFTKKAAFIGESPESEILKRELKDNPHFGYEIVSFNPQGDFLSQLQADGIGAIIAGKEIDNIEELKKNIYQLISGKVELIDLSQAYENTLEKIPVSFITKSWFLKNIRESGKGVYERIKRLADISLSLLGLLVTLPLWILIALAVKVQDGGKVFYKQERVGKDNETFKLIKFRSMREDAEKQGALWAKENDPRTTRLGRVLRASHLDELPQLINILKGDISFVGPRPERPEFVRNLEENIPHYRLRHVIKPGFTGWAQIKFRYARSIEDSQEKFEYDLFYLKNRSLLLDLGIILKTAQKFFKN